MTIRKNSEILETFLNNEGILRLNLNSPENLYLKNLIMFDGDNDGVVA